MKRKEERKEYKVLALKVRFGINGLYEPWRYEALAEMPKELPPGIFAEINEEGQWMTPPYASLDELAKALTELYAEAPLLIIPATEGILGPNGRYVSILDRTLTQYGLLTDEEIGKLAALIQKHSFLRKEVF